MLCLAENQDARPAEKAVLGISDSGQAAAVCAEGR